MKRIFLLVFIFSLFICCIDSFSQVNLSGKILDKNTGEWNDDLIRYDGEKKIIEKARTTYDNHTFLYNI